MTDTLRMHSIGKYRTDICWYHL